MLCPVVLTDDSGSDKTGPGAAEGTEPELGNDGLSDKFGKSFTCWQDMHIYIR